VIEVLQQQVILRAALHCRNGNRLLASAAENQDGNTGRHTLQRFERFDPLAVRQKKISHDARNRTLAAGGQSLDANLASAR